MSSEGKMKKMGDEIQGFFLLARVAGFMLPLVI
jgi:hypothetical protein